MEQSGGDADPATYGLTDNDKHTFIVDYGAHGILKGQGRCSTESGTGVWNGAKQPWDVTSTILLADDRKDEANLLEAEYCWCRLTEYGTADGQLQNLFSEWLFATDYRDGEAAGCDALCEDFCARMLQDEKADKEAKAFRNAMFTASSISSIKIECENNDK